jgi:hypothetical protein
MFRHHHFLLLPIPGPIPQMIINDFPSLGGINRRHGFFSLLIWTKLMMMGMGNNGAGIGRNEEKEEEGKKEEG